MTSHKLLRVCALTTLAAASLAPLLVACGSKTPDPATTAPTATAPYGQPVATAYPAQPGYPATTQPGVVTQPTAPGAVTTATTQPGAAPLASVNTTDPNSLQALIAQAQAAGAAMVSPGGAANGGGGAGDPIALGLKAVALKSAPGMTPGPIATGQVAEGGHLQFSFPMVPGTCYTIVGFAIPGTVQNLDLNVFAPPLYNVLAGQDTTDNNTPVVGAKPMCPQIPLQLTYKVDMVARKGSGSVGAQVYSKPQK